MTQPPRPAGREPTGKGSLLGFDNVCFASGLGIGEIQIHRQGSKCWAAPLTRAWLHDGDNELVRDERGR